MSKVKSAIITALLVAAIIVLGLFATISCDVPGSNGINKYNGFIGNIRLGSEFTGDAYTMLYPEGVISAADYNLRAGEAAEEGESYADKYVKYGGLYVEKEKYGKDGEIDADKLNDLAKSVESDAKIISQRFGRKGYSSYSVAIADVYSIKITLPASLTYAAYKNFEEDYDANTRSDALSDVSHTVQYLMPSGALAIKNASDDTGESILTFKETPKFYSYFKSASVYSMGGTHAVRLELTDDGFSKLNTALLTAGSSGSAYLFIGDTFMQMTLTLGTALEDKTMMFSIDNKSYVEDFAIALDSVIHNNTVANTYNTDKAGSGTQIVTQSSSFGRYAAVYLGVILLAVIVAFIVLGFVRYKKLGFVTALMTILYSLIMITALVVLDIELTAAGAFTLVLGLVLLSFTNVAAFEAIRKEAEAGRTVQASVKVGYKKTLSALLDLHIIMVVISAIIALVCVGELAACGLIFFIASLASYALYWLTRFMWYVLMSPANDKFAFCGFKREAFDDED